jgi:hypothetical protein
LNILQALDDPAVFGPWFKARASWTAWRSFLAALFGIEMDPQPQAVPCGHESHPATEQARRLGSWSSAAVGSCSFSP